MTTPIKTALTLSLILAACTGEGDDIEGSTSSSSTSIEGSSSTSSGDFNRTSTGIEEPSSSSSSSGEGITSTGEEIDPDPQPGVGEIYGECYEQTALSCPANAQCLMAEEWDSGICAQSCQTVSPAGCFQNHPKSGASLACAPLSALSPARFCVLDCTGDTSCPIGMVCEPLLKVAADDLVQKICV